MLILREYIKNLKVILVLTDIQKVVGLSCDISDIFLIATFQGIKKQTFDNKTFV